MLNDSTYEDELKKLEKARNCFITEIAKNMHLYNITASTGRLYGTVFFAEKPMTLDEMSEALGMSKTSMSTGIRSLLDADMVDRVWEKGIRKDLYKTEDDWYKSFSNVFIKRWRNATKLNLEAIEETKAQLLDLIENTPCEEIREKAEADLEKLAKAEEYYAWLTDVVSLFESGEIYNIVPKRQKGK